MTSRVGLAAALAAAFSLTACGGSAVSSLPGAPAGGAPTHGTKHKVKATIRISIPKHEHRRRIRVHGHYVSAATQSIAVTITPNGGSPESYNADLTPSSNQNCTASLISPLICTISFALAPGSYTASFATYDGLLSGGNAPGNAPTGNELSAHQNVTMTIVAGQANTLNLSLDGIPTGVLFVPSAASQMYGNMTSGFGAPKCGSAGPNQERVSVIGTDVDGGLIIGPGAPDATLTTSDSTAMAVATPPPSSPNLFTLTHPISSTAQNGATLTATVTPAADTGVSSPVSAQVLVSVSAGTQICGLFTEYPIGNANAFPQSITVGPDNNLWFTEGGIADIGQITTAGKITSFHPYNGANPDAIIAGPGNALWFADSAQSNIGEITTAGALLQAIPTGEAAGTGPNSITVGVDGNLWYTADNSVLGNSTPGGTVTQYGVSGGNAPESVVAGPDGNLWFVQGSAIGTSTSLGSLTEFSTGLSTSPGVTAITSGLGGKLWFTEAYEGDRIGTITTLGVIQEFSTLPTANAGSAAITTGPDSAMWFSETNGNNIGRITTTGSVTEYPIPSANSNPQGLVTGPDGAIWFVECTTAQIGRLQ